MAAPPGGVESAPAPGPASLGPAPLDPAALDQTALDPVPHRPTAHSSVSHGPTAIWLLPFLCLLLLLPGCSKRVGPYAPQKSSAAETSTAGSSPKYSKGNLPPVVHTIRGQLGVPYAWGGQSPNNGFDCSGLIHWAYLKHGVELPRVSWEQFRAGRKIGWNELRPGDLVFFKTDRTIRGYHVGVISLPGRFVHSPKSGGRVMESPLANPYWKDHFVGGRRVLR